METISVFKAIPGMVLGREVVNRDGRHLFDKGRTLSAKEIRILKMWGILEITVEPSAGDDRQEPEAESEVDGFLKHHFRGNDLKNPIIQSVVDACRHRFETDASEFKSCLESRKAAMPVSGSPKKLTRGDLESLLGDNMKLPSLPTIFSEINAASLNPKFTGKDIAGIVSKDPSLSATLLRIINSAYYGFSKPVESLAYAAMALGSSQVCSLALGITVINHFKGMPEGLINMESFWRHSIACGITARTLATHIKSVNGERVFIGGLLHDIGRLIYFNTYPDESAACVAQAAKLKLMLYQVEPRFFSMDHAEFGGLLAEKWQFSKEISRLIQHHHDAFKTLPPKEIAVVYFANWLVNAMGIGSSGDVALPRLNPLAWKALGIPQSALAHVIRQVDRQILEAIQFFYE